MLRQKSKVPASKGLTTAATKLTESCYKAEPDTPKVQITRSGRVVKAPQRLIQDTWTLNIWILLLFTVDPYTVWYVIYNCLFDYCKSFKGRCSMVSLCIMRTFVTWLAHGERSAILIKRPRSVDIYVCLVLLLPTILHSLLPKKAILTCKPKLYLDCHVGHSDWPTGSLVQYIFLKPTHPTTIVR